MSKTDNNFIRKSKKISALKPIFFCKMFKLRVKKDSVYLIFIPTPNSKAILFILPSK